MSMSKAFCSYFSIRHRVSSDIHAFLRERAGISCAYSDGIRCRAGKPEREFK